MRPLGQIVRSLLLGSSVALSACSGTTEEAFIASGAALVYPTFSELVEREPVQFGSVGNAIVMHRLKTGHSWALGFRRFSTGGLLGGMDAHSFTKLTIQFTDDARPQGRYALAGGKVTAYFSAGTDMLAGRSTCYAEMPGGQAEVKWLSDTKFELVLTFSAPGEQFYPKHEGGCPAVALDTVVRGEIEPFSKLTPWHGVPKSYDLDAVDDTLRETWPPM